MKKLMVVLTIVALMFTGCSFLQTVQDTLCNPPQSVIDVATAASPLVAIAINIAVPGSAVYVNAVSVQAAITAIQGGACVSLTQLNALIAWLQSDEAKSLQVQAQVKAGPAKAKAPINIQPLLNWRDGK
jgi:hypothetical protein